MSKHHSTTAASSGKPAKPYPDFPLFPHATRRWAKKIRGKLHYFGYWEDGWKAALENYEKQKDALHAGRKPREETEGTTVKQTANAFLNAKKALVQSGELSPRTWTDFKDACAEFVSAFGKGRLVENLDAEDFAALRKRLAKKRWPTC